MCGLGGFATRVAVPAASAVPIPDALDFPRAATFTQSYCTALFALRDRANLQPGETVLVLGAKRPRGPGRDPGRENSGRPSPGRRVNTGQTGSRPQRGRRRDGVQHRRHQDNGPRLVGRRRRHRLRPGRRRTRRPRPARTARTGPLRRDRVRVRGHPVPPAEPGPAAQPRDRRRRLGRLVDAEPAGPARPARRTPRHGREGRPHPGAAPHGTSRLSGRGAGRPAEPPRRGKVALLPRPPTRAPTRTRRRAPR